MRLRSSFMMTTSAASIAVWVPAPPIANPMLACEGLIAAPGRTDGNYRVYGDEHVQGLVFIRRCRSLDMALDVSYYRVRESG